MTCWLQVNQCTRCSLQKLPSVLVQYQRHFVRGITISFTNHPSLWHLVLWGEAIVIGHRFALVSYLFCSTDLYTEILKTETKWHFHALRSIFTWPQCVLTLCTVARQNWPNKMHTEKNALTFYFSVSRSGTKRLNSICKNSLYKCMNDVF